jgi:hypothetical protein
MMLRGISFGQFGLLLGGLAGALLLIYILRYRRRGRVVSTTILWRRVIGTRRSIWSEVIAFLVHFLILALVAFALTDPAPAESSIARRYVAVVIDGSLSMGAKAGEDQIRMDLAADKAWEILESLRPVDRAMVVSAGSQVRALTSFTDRQDVLKKALETIKPQGRAPRLAEGIEFSRNAFSLLSLASQDSLHLYVFTDRPDDFALPSLEGIDAKVVGIGQPVLNTGIISFDVRKPFNLTGGHELMVRVANFGSEESRARLIVYTPKATVGKEALQLSPGEEKTEHYYLPFGVQGKVTALLQEISYESGEDALVADNAAFAFIPDQSKQQVLLVTAGNLFLKKALSLNPQVALNTVTPSGYSHSRSYGYDAVIFDDFTPEAVPPANAIYIHPTGAPFTIANKVEKPSFTGWRDDHPVLRYIKLNELTIEEAHPLVLKKGDVALAEHMKDAMILAREQGGKKQIAIAFSLGKSDLPLRVAFPILFHNALVWFAESNDIEQRTSHQIGTTLQLPVKDESREVELTTPLKKTLRLVSNAGVASYTPPGPGFYTYFDGKEEKTLAVSLVDPEESDLRGARPDPAPPFDYVEGKARREKFWPLLILFAFAIIILDFWLYDNGKLP